MRYILPFTLIIISTIGFGQTQRPILDIMLTNYDYPYQVNYLDFKSQNLDLTMANMDIKPEKPNGKTVVLLHGKNFNGAYWKTTIEALRQDGYRVVVPDQIGFGKSSKPIEYQFSFQQLAQNTKAILDELKIEKINLT